MNEIVPYLVYDPETGRIVETGSIYLADIETRFEAGESIMQGEARIGFDYVDPDTREIRPRVESPAVISAAGAITGIPLPAVLDVYDDPRLAPATYDLTDDEVELEFPLPGTYRMRLSSVRHLDKWFEVVKA